MAIFFRIFQLRTWKIAVSCSHVHKFSRIILKCGKDIHCPKISEVRLWRFCLIKYAHNGPFNEPASFGIPGLIFEAKGTKFCTAVGFQMLININSGFIHNQQKIFLANFFRILQPCTRLPSSYDSDLGPFFRTLLTSPLFLWFWF